MMRISLRRVFAIITAISFVCAWIAWKHKRNGEFDRALFAIRECGGMVTFEDDYDASGLYRPIATREHHWLHEFLSPRRVSSVCFARSGITDEDLLRLQFHLEALKSIEELSLSGNEITDRGLQALPHFPNLKTLFLNETLITDRGLAHLRNYPNLRSLLLNQTSVTDDGLPVLLDLKKLEVVNLYRTDASQEGVTSMQTKAPTLRVGTPTDGMYWSESIRR